jgi:hypothetical protein
VAGMGPCKRPRFEGEGTETLANRRALAAIRDQASTRLPVTRVCQLRIAVPFDGGAAMAAFLTVSLDDRYPPITEPER